MNRHRRVKDALRASAHPISKMNFSKYLVFCASPLIYRALQNQVKKTGTSSLIQRSTLMTLKNKLGITDAVELARVEEKRSKAQAHKLFSSGFLDTLNAGSFQALASIHHSLFSEIYEFAGKVRKLNMAKGNFRFAPVMYLGVALKNIEAMPQTSFNEIIEKYVEMNIAHPFREGNGRSTRIWLDLMLKKELKQVVDWQRVDKNDYLMAMERSPVKDIEIKFLLQQALSDKIDSADIYMKGIDASYYYEGYTFYKTEELSDE